MADLNKILPIVLAVLVVLAAVQAFQLNSLKGTLAEGKLSVSSGAKAPATISSGGNAVASSGAGGPAAGATGIAALPNMVGGC